MCRDAFSEMLHVACCTQYGRLYSMSFAPSYFLIFLLIIYVRPEIVQTVLKIGPYRQPKFGDARERQYLCIMSSNSSNYAVKLLVKCRQTIRNTETRKIEPKTTKHSYSNLASPGYHRD